MCRLKIISFQVLKFWDDNSLDTEHLGYLTCVDYDGTIYDTTKYCALQAQQVSELVFVIKYPVIDYMSSRIELKVVRYIVNHENSVSRHVPLSLDISKFRWKL